MNERTEFRTVDHSRTIITELMIPSYSNFGGKVHGGLILSLMDKVAYACAAKHSGGYSVTASINAVNFLAPVEVGNLVSLHASMNFVGTSSMVVGVKVTSEDVRTGVVSHTNSSYFTMVAVGDDRKARTVPGLILKTRHDVRRYLEAIDRKQIINEYRQAFDHKISDDELKVGFETLKDYRCQVEYSL